MKNIFIFTVIIILSFLSIASGEEIGKIEGYVFNQEDNGTVGKVKVILDGKLNTETDGEGYFYFNDVPYGNHNLTFERQGWVFPDTPVLLKKSSVERVEIKGYLTNWAYMLITYVFIVILLMALAGNALILMDHYALPKPTRVLSFAGVMIAFGAIAMAIAKLDTMQSLMFILVITLSTTLSLKKGSEHSKIKIIEDREHNQKKLEDMEKEKQEKMNKLNELIGKEGAAVTELKLYGKIEIDKKTYEAKSRKDFIKKGQKICIVELSGNTIVVEKGSYSKYA